MNVQSGSPAEFRPNANDTVGFNLTDGSKSYRIEVSGVNIKYLKEEKIPSLAEKIFSSQKENISSKSIPREFVAISKKSLDEILSSFLPKGQKTPANAIIKIKDITNVYESLPIKTRKPPPGPPPVKEQTMRAQPKPPPGPPPMMSKPQRPIPTPKPLGEKPPSKAKARNILEEEESSIDDALRIVGHDWSTAPLQKPKYDKPLPLPPPPQVPKK